MQQNHKNQTGSLPILVILSIAVVVAIAASAFVVYRDGHSHPKTQTDTTTGTAQPSTQPSVSSTSGSSQSTAQASLVIKEWNISIPYSGSDTFSYVLSPDGKTASIASKALANADSACATWGAGVIERFAPSDSASSYGSTTIAEDAQQNPGTYVYVNGYYYLFRHSQAACGSVSTADQNQANNTIQQALPKMQSVTASTSATSN